MRSICFAATKCLNELIETESLDDVYFSLNQIKSKLRLTSIQRNRSNNSNLKNPLKQRSLTRHSRWNSKNLSWFIYARIYHLISYQKIFMRRVQSACALHKMKVFNQVQKQAGNVKIVMKNLCFDSCIFFKFCWLADVMTIMSISPSI